MSLNLHYREILASAFPEYCTCIQCTICSTNINHSHTILVRSDWSVDTFFNPCFVITQVTWSSDRSYNILLLSLQLCNQFSAEDKCEKQAFLEVGSNWISQWQHLNSSIMYTRYRFLFGWHHNDMSFADAIVTSNV